MDDIYIYIYIRANVCICIDTPMQERMHAHLYPLSASHTYSTSYMCIDKGTPKRPTWDVTFGSCQELRKIQDVFEETAVDGSPTSRGLRSRDSGPDHLVLLCIMHYGLYSLFVSIQFLYSHYYYHYYCYSSYCRALSVHPGPAWSTKGS